MSTQHPNAAQTLETLTLNENLLCVEFGYRQCEKGNNLQKALEEARKILTKPTAGSTGR